MAKKEQFTLSVNQRQNRSFSEEFRISKVREYEIGQSTVSEISRAYEVSRKSIYKWIKKYGQSSTKSERLIVEKKSATRKLIELKSRIAELEQLLGKKQIQLELQEKMLDIAEEQLGEDFKKKRKKKR